MITIKTKVLAIVMLASLLVSACEISIPMIPGLKKDGVQVPALEVKVKIAGETEPAPTDEPAFDPIATETPEEFAEVVASFVSLKYDETDGENVATGQTRLIAFYLRDAQAAGATQEAMEQAAAAIQQEADTVEASVFEGNTLQLDEHWAWLVWCSNADGVNPPADVSDVFDMLPQGPARFWIQVPFAEGVPLRSDNTWTGCADGFWAVTVH